MSGLSKTATEDLSESGRRALKLQTDTPHLVSMGGDRLSTSVTLHPIPQGRVVLGSSPGVDIPVQGTGVSPVHCQIENSEGVVTIYPLSGVLLIDGVEVVSPTRLSQGSMITIGRSNYMRFNHPDEAKLIKAVLPNPRISMAPIEFESDNTYLSKFTKKPPTVPRKNQKENFLECEEPPSNIMMKVSKFEYLAAQNLKKSISPKVFTSNAVTVNTPAKDVLGRSPPDLKSFAKSMPQSALNYSNLNYNDKDHSKIPDRQLLGKKASQYVNVSLNDAKNINNRVIVYENQRVYKDQNVNFDQPSYKSQADANKNINIKILTPSVGYNRNSPPYKSASYNMKETKQINNDGLECSNGGPMNERCAEMKRNQVQEERIKDQELDKAEQARLEEILNMCAEYERQSQLDKSKPITPNRIKTNGSLPRDKRQHSPFRTSPYNTPPMTPSDFELQRTFHDPNNKTDEYSGSNVPRERIKTQYENVRISPVEFVFPTAAELDKNSANAYENVFIVPSHSPRTKIKTFVSANKETSTKDNANNYDQKLTVSEKDEKLFESLKIAMSLSPNSEEESSTRFILPLDDSFLSLNGNQKLPNVCDEKSILMELEGKTHQEQHEYLKKEKALLQDKVCKIKRLVEEIEIQEDELKREIDMEKALLTGEFQSKLIEVERATNRKQKLQKRIYKIEDCMRDCQTKQTHEQQDCKEKLEAALTHMTEMDKKLLSTEKTSPQYQEVFEEHLQCQEKLDNNRKAFEDLEFHHLEEEANWLASREEVQREILELSRIIENLQAQAADLEKQKVEMTSSNANEYKNLQVQRLSCLLDLEEVRHNLKTVNQKLLQFTDQDTELEVSSDSDSDYSKDASNIFSNFNCVQDLSSSCIIIDSKVANNNSLMTQSFNENLMGERSILESGLGKRVPSQDDIDRISKVTSSAPIDIQNKEKSLGRKTIESLKEIERNRRLHLCQQGSQVIEQERQRLQVLKERAQQEGRTKWEQQMHSPERTLENHDGSIGNKSEDSDGAYVETPVKPSNLMTTSYDSTNPRPLSEVSEMSIETGTLTKKRERNGDKQRPLTRYLPIKDSDLDLRQHIESAGHQVVLCPHVIINSNSCRGFLHKKGLKLNGWSRRWFVFDRLKHTFSYYSDKTEKKPRGGAYFQAIEEVYVDHSKIVKSPNPQLTFIVKTHARIYYFMAPSPEAMRIWVDVIFTGAEGYQEFENTT